MQNRVSVKQATFRNRSPFGEFLNTIDGQVSQRLWQFTVVIFGHVQNGIMDLA